MIVVDGSFGEGGGQIVRSAITISTIIKKPIKIVNIRSNRNVPGLKNQHITTIQLLSKLFNIKTQNVKPGSEWISFEPNKYDHYNMDNVEGKKTINADIRTAGSIPLLLQSLIPVISITQQKNITFRLTGGTDVRYSPTIDYIKYVLKEAYSKIGITFDIKILKRGFYPSGQGIIETEIKKADTLCPIECHNFKEVDPQITSIVGGGLSKHVTDRQISSAIAFLEKNGIRCNRYRSALENSKDKGSSILIYSVSESGIYLGSDMIGEKGITAEVIGNKAAKKFLRDYYYHACIDQHLADMLVLPLCFVKDKSRYKISRITDHLLTNLELLKKMTGLKYQIEKVSDHGFILTLQGASII